MTIKEKIDRLRKPYTIIDKGYYETMVEAADTLEALNKVYVAADAYFNCKGMFPPERPVIDAIAEVKAIQEGK